MSANHDVPADWTPAERAVAHEVFHLRHTLQKGMLTREKPVDREQMDFMSKCIKKLEIDHVNVEFKIIFHTKIQKVMKRILLLEDIPREAELKIKERCQKLLDQFEKTIKTNVAAQKNEMKKLKKAQQANKRQLAIDKVQEGFRTMESLFVSALKEMQCDQSDTESDDFDTAQRAAMQEQLRVQQIQIKQLQEEIRRLGETNNKNGDLMRNIIEEHNNRVTSPESSTNPFRGDPAPQDGADISSTTRTAESTPDSDRYGPVCKNRITGEVIRRHFAARPGPSSIAVAPRSSMPDLSRPFTPPARVDRTEPYPPLYLREGWLSCYLCGLCLPREGLEWNRKKWRLTQDNDGNMICDPCLSEFWDERRERLEEGIESLHLLERRQKAMGRNEVGLAGRGVFLARIRERTNLWPKGTPQQLEASMKLRSPVIQFEASLGQAELGSRLPHDRGRTGMTASRSTTFSAQRNYSSPLETAEPEGTSTKPWTTDETVACFLCGLRGPKNGRVYGQPIYDFTKDGLNRDFCKACLEAEQTRTRYEKDNRIETEWCRQRRMLALSLNGLRETEKVAGLHEQRRRTGIWPDGERPPQGQPSLLGVLGYRHEVDITQDVSVVRSGMARTTCYLCGIMALGISHITQPQVTFKRTAAGFKLCSECLAEERRKTADERADGHESDSLLMRRQYALIMNADRRVDRARLLEEIRERTNIKPRTNLHSRDIRDNGPQATRNQPTMMMSGQSRDHGMWTARPSLGGLRRTMAAQERSLSQPNMPRFRKSTALGSTPEANHTPTTCCICRRQQPKEGMWDSFQEHHNKLYCNSCYDEHRANRTMNVLRADGTWGKDETPKQKSGKGPQSNYCFTCLCSTSKRGWRPSLADEPVDPEKQYCFECYNKDLLAKALGDDSDTGSGLSSPPDTDDESRPQETNKRKRSVDEQPSTSSRPGNDSNFAAQVGAEPHALPKRQKSSQQTARAFKTYTLPSDGDDAQAQEADGFSDDDVIPIRSQRSMRRSLSQRPSANHSLRGMLPESEDDEDEAVSASLSTSRSATPHVSGSERMAHNKRMWNGILDSHPDTCKEWLGMSSATFCRIEDRLVQKGGLQESQGISARERLAIFLNLMTTGESMLTVARRWSPQGTRAVNTIGSAAADVIECLQRLSDEAMPYTFGRKGNAATPPIPDSLNDDKEIWETFNWCLGGLVHIYPPERRVQPSGMQSSSRAIIAGFDGVFRSMKIDWAKHNPSAFNMEDPPNGILKADFWKTFIIADQPYSHIEEVEGLVQNNQGHDLYGKKISEEEYKLRYADALKPTQRMHRTLTKRLLNKPSDEDDKTGARKRLNNNPCLVPAVCVIFNLMIECGEFDYPPEMRTLEEMEDEISAAVRPLADDRSGGGRNQMDVEVTQNLVEENASESDDDEYLDPRPTGRGPPSKKAQLSHGERRAVNDRMIKDILSDPAKCKEWFGISEICFNKVLSTLVAAGVPETAAMSKMERLALFLNLMTSGDSVLTVARRFGPRMCATVGKACNAVVQALMTIIDRFAPYTLGREHNADRLPMPSNLEGQEEIWEHFYDCLGSVVFVCPPTTLNRIGAFQSTSRVIIAALDGKFKSAEIQWKKPVADFRPHKLGAGKLIKHADKSFVISDRLEAKHVDGFVQVEEGPNQDPNVPPIELRHYRVLHAKAINICARLTKSLKQHFPRKATNKLPNLVPASCVLFNMLVELGEFELGEEDGGATDGEGNGQVLQDGDEDGDEEEFGGDVTMYPGEGAVDEEAEDQIMGDADAEVASEVEDDAADVAVKPEVHEGRRVSMSEVPANEGRLKRESRYLVMLNGVKHEGGENEEDIYN